MYIPNYLIKLEIFFTNVLIINDSEILENSSVYRAHAGRFNEFFSIITYEVSQFDNYKKNLVKLETPF